MKQYSLNSGSESHCTCTHTANGDKYSKKFQPHSPGLIPRRSSNLAGCRGRGGISERQAKMSTGVRFVALACRVATESLANGARMLTMATAAAATATATTAVNVVMGRVRTGKTGGGRRQLRDVVFKLCTAVSGRHPVLPHISCLVGHCITNTQGSRSNK